MGAHAAPLPRAPLRLVLLLLLLRVAATDAAAERESLVSFKSSLKNGNEALGSWNDKSAPCDGDRANWIGVLCSKGSVWGLKLEDMGLTGDFNVDPLVKLPSLRTISLMNNNLGGAFPEIKKLGALKTIYLSNNQFSGEIPDEAFAGMASLKKVHLARNKFTGRVPKSMANLPRLLELNLEGNKFEGQIPEFQSKELKILDLSNNQFAGPVPASLNNIDSSSFSGNQGLCGGQLKPCEKPAQDNQPKSPENRSNSSSPSGEPKPQSDNSSNKLSGGKIAAISIASALALVAVILVLFFLRRRDQVSESVETPSPIGHTAVNLAGKVSPENFSGGGVGKKGDGIGGKLTFLRDDREKFDLQDLLRASAEILGSGCFGSSYKANLVSGPAVVVKRYKQMNNVGREEFQEHMRRLGRLRHQNLLPVVAYYYRKEEKLLVADFVEKGSLAVHLHAGNHAHGRSRLNWTTRLKIIKGVAKGLVYLYNELPSLITPHGHLKSSNVLLNKSFDPLLNDYGLVPVINHEHAQQFMVAYKSPEYAQHGRVTKKTDVWNLGVLILEIMTGKFPTNYLQQGKGTSEEMDLVTWVSKAVNEESMEEVFDKEMGSTLKPCEGEMLKLLKIGLACCEGDVEKRWDLKEAVGRIEEVREKDGDGDFFSARASEADMLSSRGKSDDFIF